MLTPKHKLSNIDKENLMADCAKCGRVKVYCHVAPNRTRYRCQIARKELKQKYPGQTIAHRTLTRQKIVAAQNNRCAICSKEAKLVLDHDHISGFVRGALCHNCNTGLGHFFDNTSTLYKAIEYLRYAQDGSGEDSEPVLY